MASLIRLAVSAAGLAILGACAVLSPPPDPRPVDLRFQEGIRSMEEGNFRAAAATFEEVASRCESGRRGRSALLLLATLSLDVRNPWQDPERAAYLASAYLRLPEAPPEELSLARTLYVLALDRGAPSSLAGGPEAGGDVEPPISGLAKRFSRCDGGGVVERVRVLPPHPGPRTADQLEAARVQADSLRSELDSVATELRRTRARIGELETELERIRKLLKGGGGSPRPDRP